MVIIAELSCFFTSTPSSCETVAVATDALAVANRTIPSSCFSLISLSPHAAIIRRSCAALLDDPCVPAALKISPLRSIHCCTAATITLGFRPVALGRSLLLNLPDSVFMKQEQASLPLHAQHLCPARLLRI